MGGGGGGTGVVFELLALKAKIKAVLTGYAIAMVTTYGKKAFTTC